jgi:hypothetical protein
MELLSISSAYDSDKSEIDVFVAIIGVGSVSKKKPDEEISTSNNTSTYCH